MTIFPVDAPTHLIGEGVTDLRCHHSERDYSNLIHRSIYPGSM